MADFTVAEIENIANSALDFYMDKRKVTPQTLQDKPLLKALRGAQKTFPGGKEYISGAVKGEYTSTLQGFQNDDTVGYSNPTNTKRYNYPWKLHHIGIQFSMDELLRDGISITESTTGKGTAEHSDREMTALVNILEEKFDDMMEGRDRGWNTMLWGDGTSDSTDIPGVTSIVVLDPTTATTVGGIDQSANTWWRNLAANTSIDASTASNLNIIKALKADYRQLRRYGGNPKLWLAGSDFIEALENEVLSKGNLTDNGFSSKRDTDVGMAEINFKGNTIMYDPTLDDLGWAKRMYAFDTRHLFRMVIEGEDGKRHNPARPENKYVFYRAMTDASGLVCNKRNVHGVWAIQ